MRHLNLAFLWWYNLWGHAINNQLLLIKEKILFFLTILCMDFLEQETIKLCNKKVMYFYKTIEIRNHISRSLHISASRDWRSWVVMSAHTILHTFSISYSYSYFNVQRKEKDPAFSPFSQAPLTKRGSPWQQIGQATCDSLTCLQPIFRWKLHAIEVCSNKKKCINSQ